MQGTEQKVKSSLRSQKGTCGHVTWIMYGTEQKGKLTKITASGNKESQLYKEAKRQKNCIQQPDLVYVTKEALKNKKVSLLTEAFKKQLGKNIN